MAKGKFTGTKVDFYQMPSGEIYAVAVEFDGGKAVDAEKYDVLAMTEAEVRELVNVGGVYTEAPTPRMRAKQIENDGTGIALSVIQNGGVELQWCHTEVPCIKKAFEWR